MKREMKNNEKIIPVPQEKEATALLVAKEGRRTTTKTTTIASILLVIIVGIITTTSAVITTTNMLHIQVPLLIPKAYACVQPSQGGGEGDQRCTHGQPGIPTKICDSCCDITCFGPSLGDGSGDECGSSFVVNNGGGGPSDQVASINHRGSQVVNDGNRCGDNWGEICDSNHHCQPWYPPNPKDNYWGDAPLGGRYQGHFGCTHVSCFHSENGPYSCVMWRCNGSPGSRGHQAIGPLFNPHTDTNALKKGGGDTTTTSTADSVKKVGEDLTTAIADGNNNKLKNKDTDHHSSSEPQLEVIQPDHKFHHEDSSGTSNHDKGNDGKSKDDGGDKSGKGGDGSSGSDPDSSVKDIHR